MKDVLMNIKERLNNPFIFSFIIAWFLWNWEVTIAFIFYSANNLDKLGYTSYKDVLDAIDFKHAFIYPGASALGYTFLFPLLKMFINSFNAFIDTRDQKNVFKISETGVIPTIKYLELQKTYDGYIKDLSGYFEKEGATKQQVLNLENRLLVSEQQTATLANQNLEVRKITDRNRLSGLWYVWINRNYTIGEKEYMVENSFLKLNWEEGFYEWNINNDHIGETSLTKRSNMRDIMILSYICDPYIEKFILTIKEHDNNYTNNNIFNFHLYWNKEEKSIYGDGIMLTRDRPKDIDVGNVLNYI